MLDWIEKFEGLSRLAPDIRQALERKSRIVTVRRDTVIFGPGVAPKDLLLLLNGSLRVSQTSEAGREIVLYRVHAGESCVLTTACLLAYEDYTAEGIAETDLSAVAIPRDVFDDLISRSGAFRRFVFTAYSRRITDLFHVIEEVAFRRVDVRLAQRLLELDDGGGRVAATHQKLAAELGSAREVVSRQLGEFQRRGWVRAERGAVVLVDRAALDRLAKQ